MASITIETITIPYERELLLRWKQRDPKVVPSFMLDWGGPGVSNGYGFGEWIAERYFREIGYYVFTNEFNLLSKTSKFSRYNKMIETMVSKEQLNSFKEALKTLLQNEYTVENPDLFVFNLESCFFAEIKKENDKLREPQTRFFYLAKKYLGIESKLIYLCEHAATVRKEYLTFPSFTIL